MNLIETLELRRMLSGAGRTDAYIPDYRAYAGVLTQMDWSTFTHVDYFSFKPEQFMPNPGTGVYTSPTHSSGDMPGQLMDTTLMDSAVTAAHNHSVPISLVIGGAGYSSGFIGVFDTQAHIDTFITNVTTFAAAHHFDGIDFDWEPGWDTATPDQVTDYGNLITSFKAEAPALTLTAAVAPTPQPMDPNETLPFQYVLTQAAIRALDYVNVMAYDFAVPDHSNYSDATSALNNWSQYADSTGALNSHFVLGLPFYGDKGTSFSDVQQATYQEIVTAYHPAASADTAGGYDFNGKTTIGNKVDYVVNNHFGGVMVWDIGQDSYQDPTYELTPVIKSHMAAMPFAAVDTNGLLVASGEGQDDSFTLGTSGSNITIKLGSSTLSFPTASVNSILINGHGGDDTLDFNGPVSKPLTFDGGAGFDSLNVDTGTLTLGSDTCAGNNALVINVAAGASAVFNSGQHLDGLNLLGSANVAAGGSNTLVTHGLTIGSAGQLNLRNNSLIVDYASDTTSPIGTRSGSSYTGITGMIQSGRDGGKWDGHGIVTTSASGNITTLAVAEASQALGSSGGTFRGESVDGSAVLVRFTYGGDANLDGKINVDDYIRIDSGIAAGLSAQYNGDFNYDGKINIDDYTQFIDANIGVQGSTPIPSASLVTQIQWLTDERRMLDVL